MEGLWMMSSSKLKLFVFRLLVLLVLYSCFSTLGFAQNSLDPLLKNLADPKPAVRIAAIQKVLENRLIFDTDVFRLVLAALSDTDPAMRKYAAMCLRDSRDNRTVPALLTLLNDPNPNIRAAVIEALQEIADPRAVKPLSIVWQTDKEERLRNQAFSALLSIADMRITDTLLAMLQDPDKCKLAIEALGEVGDDRAFEPLMAILKDDNTPQGSNALIELGAFGDPRVADYVLPKLTPESGTAYFILDSLDPRVIPPILKNIDTYKWMVSGLRKLHDERAVDILIRLAGDKLEKRQTRCFAIEALGGINDSRAVPTLIKSLQEKTTDDISLCYTAIEALGNIGDAQTIPALLPLLENKDEQIRSAVVVALRKIQSPLAIDGLLTLTKTTDYFMRNEALYALLCIPDARAVQIVVTMLLNPHDKCSGSDFNEEDFYLALAKNPFMTEEHYLSLLQKGDGNIFLALASTPIHNQHLLDAMVQWMVKNAGYWTPDASFSKALSPYGKAGKDALLAQLDNIEIDRSMIITMLGEMGDQRAIPPLMSIFKNYSSPEVIIALGKLGAKDIAPRLLKIARATDGELFTQMAAYEALGDLKEQGAFDFLVAELKSNDKKASAARGLGKLGDIRAVAPLITALQEDPEAATWALLQLPPDPRTIDPLLDILHNGNFLEGVQQRIYAAEALARFPDERILFDFCQVLHQNSHTKKEPLKRTLIHLLGERKDPRAVRTLIRFTYSASTDPYAMLLNISNKPALIRFTYSDSTDPGVAVEATWALGEIGDARAIPALINVVNDDNPDVRTAAADSLQKLTGQNYGNDHARWVAWWTKTKEAPE